MLIIEGVLKCLFLNTWWCQTPVRPWSLPDAILVGQTFGVLERTGNRLIVFQNGGKCWACRISTWACKVLVVLLPLVAVGLRSSQWGLAGEVPPGFPEQGVNVHHHQMFCLLLLLTLQHRMRTRAAIGPLHSTTWFLLQSFPLYAYPSILLSVISNTSVHGRWPSFYAIHISSIGMCDMVFALIVCKHLIFIRWWKTKTESNVLDILGSCV